jgi:hypothetical protein
VAGSAVEIFATLLHEAVHAVAFERGIKDTSRQGRYHNARFRAVAEELGLEAGRDSPFGWSSTALAPGTTALYRETLRALTEALGDHRDHATALGDAWVRRHPRDDQHPRDSGAFSTRPERFELPTFGSVDRRSIQLSYGRLTL